MLPEDMTRLHVIIPLGSKVPYVVRKRLDCNIYDLLGEAYVDGVMDGEMFCESSQVDIEIINIV